MSDTVAAEATWHDATPAQQGIWVLDTDEKIRPTYLVPTVLEFAGPVDHAVLVDAVRLAVSRHPALRSRFRLDVRSHRVRYRCDGPPGDVGFIDAVGEGWTPEELDRLVDLLCRTPFDLATEAPVRAEVIRVDPLTTLLVLTSHHIVFDGWSRHLLVDEITATYRSLLAGRPPALAPPVHPAAVLAPVPRAALTERVDHVVERLRGAPMTVELPYDRRPADGEVAVLGDTLSVELDEELTAKLMLVAAQEGATPFMTAVALLAGTLSRSTRQRDFLIAFGWPGREDPATADAIGMFMSTLVLRLAFDETTTWRELLRGARVAALEAFMDADVPLDAVATALNPTRTVIWPPLTPVLVNVDDLPSEISLAPEVRGGYRHTGPVYTKYDLDLFVRLDDGPRGSRMTLSIDYPLDLFDRDTVEGLLSDIRRSAVDLAHSAEEPHGRPAGN